MHRVEEVPAVPIHGRNRIARDDRVERQAVPERLAERRHVRHDVVVRVHEGEQVARAPDPRVRFVDDQKHVAGFAVRFRRFEVTRRSTIMPPDDRISSRITAASEPQGARSTMEKPYASSVAQS